MSRRFNQSSSEIFSSWHTSEIRKTCLRRWRSAERWREAQPASEYNVCALRTQRRGMKDDTLTDKIEFPGQQQTRLTHQVDPAGPAAVLVAVRGPVAAHPGALQRRGSSTRSRSQLRLIRQGVEVASPPGQSCFRTWKKTIRGCDSDDELLVSHDEVARLPAGADGVRRGRGAPARGAAAA